MGRHRSGLFSALGMFSELLGGIDCERRFDLIDPKEIPDILFSSREERRVLSPELVWEDMIEIHEFLLNAEGIFWVSMAAGGGFLLNRFPDLTSVDFAFSSSCLDFFSLSFCSFSAFFFSLLFLFSPWSDQLGDKHISSAAESSPSRAVLVLKGSTDGLGFSGTFSVSRESGPRTGNVCERGMGVGRNGDCGIGGIGGLCTVVGEGGGRVDGPLK